MECNRCVGVRTQGDATASHVDHTIASLAEVGTRSISIHTRRATDDSRSARSSLKTFEINQVEYEWSAPAYTLYCEVRVADNYGQKCRSVAGGSVDPALQTGCVPRKSSAHPRRDARADEQHPLARMPKRVVAHLMKVTGVLVASQDGGYWNCWATGEPPRAGDDNEQSQLDPLGRRWWPPAMRRNSGRWRKKSSRRGKSSSSRAVACQERHGLER